MPLSQVIQVPPASAGLSSARCMLLLEPQRQDSTLISCMAADYAAATSFMPVEPGTTG